MPKHRAPRPSLFVRMVAPIAERRAFQLKLDQSVAAVLNDAGMTVGGVQLNAIVRQDDLDLLRLAAEVMNAESPRKLLANRDDSLRQVAQSIQRVHRLSLSHAYEMV